MKSGEERGGDQRKPCGGDLEKGWREEEKWNEGKPLSMERFVLLR